MYMMEVDRVLRPGGYWVLSGPPINWRTNFQAWSRPKEELEEEQRKIEEIANLLCWEKKHEMGEIAIWRKRVNYDHCHQQNVRRKMCQSKNADDVWYTFKTFFTYYGLFFFFFWVPSASLVQPTSTEVKQNICFSK